MEVLRKVVFGALLGCAALLASCQPSYYYHFPKESEMRGIASDSLKWRYSASTISQIPVADDAGNLFWLDVTDKTKLLVTSILGEEYRFYLRSIVVENGDAGIFGQSAQWTGYDIHEHVHRTIMAREINTITVMAESPAVHRISH